MITSSFEKNSIKFRVISLQRALNGATTTASFVRWVIKADLIIKPIEVVLPELVGI